MYATRIERLCQALSASGFDALALNPGPSLVYLTGLHFHLMERPTVLLVAPGQKPGLVLANLEMGKAQSGALDLQTFSFGDNPALWGQSFEQAIQALGLNGKRIGVEPNRMRFLELSYLQQAAPQARFESAESVLNGARMQKDPDEVAAMRRAVEMAQQALLATLPFIRAGVTEKAVAAELFLQLLKAGSEPEVPFMPIVAGGPNSANPHAAPSDRPLQNGDLLVIDWGARYQGYCSDLTRTFAIGEVDPELRHIVEVTGQANAAGRAASQPEVTAGSVDAAARGVIEAAGYGPQFFHRVGHGLGLEEHEPPYMFGENQLVLLPGMSYTVEPGIYLAGRGGTRIEDNVVITAAGCETLSNLPRELIKLG
jgi:Xaa-Pro dipeptidase